AGGGDLARRDGPVQLGHRGADEVDHGHLRVLVQRDGDALLRGAEGVEQHAHAAVLVALDVLEQQGGAALLLADHVGDGAHLLIPVDVLGDALELADLLDARHPLAQVSHRHVRSFSSVPFWRRRLRCRRPYDASFSKRSLAWCSTCSRCSAVTRRAAWASWRSMASTMSSWACTMGGERCGRGPPGAW